MPSVARAGAEIYYDCHGAGPALVFAHGAGGNAASWWQQVPFFVERGFRVLCFDHRGFGRSRAEGDAQSITEFVPDLEAMLDAEGIERAALVCQSMGGWSGLPFALAYPERVRALVLCGTPGGVFTDEVAAARAELGARIEAAGGLTAPGGPALGRSFAEKEPRLTFLYNQIAAFNVLDLGPLFGQIDEVRIDAAALAGFATPTAVLMGHEDVLFPPEAMRSVAVAIPGAELVEFPNAGHSTYFEQPDRFNEVVAEFLARNP